MSVYIVGDMHGDYIRFQSLCENMTEDDVVIQLGDHGCYYYKCNLTDKVAKEFSKVKPRVILLRGNHDRYIGEVEGYHTIKVDDELMFAEAKRRKESNLLNYEELIFFNNIEKNDRIKGVFFWSEVFPNLLFCEMLNDFSINGKTFLSISGAYSVDKDFRILNNYKWFEDEQLTQKEKDYFKNVYYNDKNFNKSFDYIISHTCPFKYIPTHLFLSVVDQSKVDNSMEIFLDWIEENIEYNQYYCGHYHSTEKLWDKGKIVYTDAIILNDI